MNWSVTYRGKGGGQEVVRIDAENRKALFNVLAQRGIKPIRIEQYSGRNVSIRTTSSSVPKGFLRIVLWCAGILSLAGVVFFFYSDAKDEVHIGRQREEKQIKGKSHSLVAPSKESVPESESQSRSTGVSPLDGELGIENTDMRIDPVNGQIPKNTVNKEPLPPPTYKSNSDELIAMAISVPPDAELPPLPFDAAAEIQFKQSLDKPIEILDTDSEDVVKMKKAVMETRAQIAELVKQGMTLKEIITEHRELFNANVKVRNECIAELNEIFESGDIQGAKKYMTTINLALQQMGIEEIEMPLTLEERIERAKAIKLQREQQEKEKRQ